ncbi:BCCT family transporter [Actinomyces sp. zg-332]|uniref:BCCT family transporter n=1 Tax=Actinomyces sp. zg-332 TaxID=2708340 RepID=UPI0018E071D6|nr:BCCT family transporter [Actinomyces sp. zg-332]QPK93855.1 BCCT family transporter [Actinomyces sp. zg-332]
MNSLVNEDKKEITKQVDWLVMLVPLVIVIALCVLFTVFPSQSSFSLSYIRSFLSDDLGIYYAILGLGTFICSIYIAFSRFGKIILGNNKLSTLGRNDPKIPRESVKACKPEYSSFRWGVMVFTSTMAADIVFYSLCEWALYANESHIKSLGNVQTWASTYPLFHWGPIAWSFYVLLAVSFGFMLHTRKRDKQKFSEACRPILGKYTDGVAGKVIDLVAIFSLIAGTATTFSLATPLLSSAVSKLFNLSHSTSVTIFILLLIALIYTVTVLIGMDGISKLATYCSYLFFVLLFYFLFLGGETRYILETGLSSLGNLVQNFVTMSTWLDPLRETSFPQKWTLYYWAYWMVWCVATPFFIGTISRGRSIKKVILEGYAWGIAGTFTSFIILGNYGLAQELKHGLDVSGTIAKTNDYSRAILEIFNTLPLPNVALILLVVTMIAFYSTTFDALTMVVSAYSYKNLELGKTPSKKMRTFWSITFILFPIALIFSENSMFSLQSVSIIAAFPIGIAIILIIASFIKDANLFLNEQ